MEILRKVKQSLDLSHVQLTNQSEEFSVAQEWPLSKQRAQSQPSLKDLIRLEC